MGLLKKLPISDLYKIQEKLVKCGVNFLLPGLFGQHDKLYEADVINLLEAHVTEKGGTLIHPLSGCGAGINSHTVRYVPRGRGRRIGNGDKVVVEIAYRKKPETSSYLAVQLREAKDRLRPILNEHTSRVLLLAKELSVRFDADHPAISNLANLYLSRTPELHATTTVEDFAGHIANALRAYHFETFLSEYQYYAETFVVGDKIHSKELAKHKAVINALCVALECLQERTSYPTYQDIQGRVYRTMLQEAGKKADGYWMKTHEVQGSDTLHSFPFAYGLPGGELTPADGRVLEGHRLYLHPFIRGVHYGFVVTVTTDGWTIH